MPYCTCELLPTPHRVKDSVAHDIDLAKLRAERRRAATQKASNIDPVTPPGPSAVPPETFTSPNAFDVSMDSVSDVPEANRLAEVDPEVNALVDLLEANRLADVDPEVNALVDLLASLGLSNTSRDETTRRASPTANAAALIEQGAAQAATFESKATQPHATPPKPQATPTSSHSRRSSKPARKAQVQYQFRSLAENPQPTPLRVQSAMEVLNAVDQNLIQVGVNLTAGCDNPATTPGVEAIRTRVDIAGQQVAACANALHRVVHKDPEVVKRKVQVTERLSHYQAVLTLLEEKLPPVPPSGPVEYSTDYVFGAKMSHLDTIAQVVIILGFICNAILGLSEANCNFILSVVVYLVKMVMSLHLPKDQSSYNPLQENVLKQLPVSLYQALKHFGHERQSILYAICPTCTATYKGQYNIATLRWTFQTHCNSRILDGDGATCNTELLDPISRNPKSSFLVGSFTDYLARLLADPVAEQHCLDAVSKMNNGTDSTSVFDSSFLESFDNGAGVRFTAQKDALPLAFTLHWDCYNPQGNRRRGDSRSVGVLSLACLNLPVSIRYLPEYLFVVAIVPMHPSRDEVNNFVRPIIDQLEPGWSRGFHLSRTALSSSGRRIQTALIISLNDLPAARQIAGLAGVKSNWLCSVCKLFGRENVWNTDWDSWGQRDPAEMRAHAEAWRDATTSAERDAIFKEHGIRWSELWRLPYWDPTRMLVIDSMHALLEGVVHYHCRLALQLRTEQAKDRKEAAFYYPWDEYDNDAAIDDEYRCQPSEVSQIANIQKRLCSPIGDGGFNELEKYLLNRNKQPLKFVAYSLRLPMDVWVHGKDVHTTETLGAVHLKAQTKSHFAKILIAWCKEKPLGSGAAVSPPTASPDTIRYIQQVIRDTDTPSWLNGVPKNYGEAGAGSLKADEWRILSTVYLPIALVTLWGDDDGAAPEKDSTLFRVLDHTMALFQAVTIALRYSISKERALEYRRLIKEWIDNLREVHPHTKKHDVRPNFHACLHIYDFLLLFGPVISWWCFPFERLIGMLQKIPTNGHEGVAERTVFNSFLKKANVRRWLGRSDLPEPLHELRRLFNLVQSPVGIPRGDKRITRDEVAYLTYDEVKFSPRSVHVGNSVIMYNPSPTSTTLVAGEIQKIVTSEARPYFEVKRHLPLPDTLYDPFLRYPSFPARTFSSRLSDTTERVYLDQVVGHGARYKFPRDRVVVLNLSRM